MNSALRIISITLLTFSLSACAHTTEISSNERRIFKLYAMAALFEFCNDKGLRNQCNEINKKLDTLEPEIYFFQNADKREVLVVYTLNDYYPDVILRYDKDGLLKITNRGIWFSHKQEFINEFLNPGNSFIDDSYAE